jgi:hypothetical protein
MRYRHLAARALLLALLLPLHAAFGRICSLDKAPAATLLLPYFEVDLDRPLGRTTLFSVNNAVSTAVLTNITLWSDLGVPTLWFQMYLTGYDVQTINLRDVFNGLLPQTASAGQDPLDVISPRGSLSQDIDFPSCVGVFPFSTLPGSFSDHLRRAHTGKFSPLLDGCAGQGLGDNVARGYITVDTVSRCLIKNPSEPGYFGPGGMATNQNVLWGDFVLIDQDQNFAQGEDLVRLEADPTRFKSGDSTFYGRYVGKSAIDAREPLPSRWGSRYVVAGAFTGGTDLLVWRESGGAVSPFPCGQIPARFPLLTLDQAYFDEQENVQVPWEIILDPPLPPEFLQRQFPAESNRVDVRTDYGVFYDFGWLYLDFGPFPGAAAGERRQAWVGTLVSAEGRYSAGMSATPLGPACAPAQPGSR